MKEVTLKQDHYDAGKKYPSGGTYEFSDEVANFIKKEQGIVDAIEADARKKASAKIESILPRKENDDK